jgi:hypothetical protein
MLTNFGLWLSCEEKEETIPDLAYPDRGDINGDKQRLW